MRRRSHSASAGPSLALTPLVLVHKPAGNGLAGPARPVVPAGPAGPVGPVRPAVARTATASRIPRAAVAVSGIAYGGRKPDTAACGPDAAPMSSAVQPGHRRRFPQACAVHRLRAAAARPTTTRPAVGPASRADV